MDPGQYQPGDRRPIPSRERRLWIAVASSLVRHGISANAISLCGLAAGILAGLSFWLTTRVDFPAVAWLVGAALILLRLVANMLDGMVAVQSGLASRLGELYNELPDRASDAAVIIGLGFASGGTPWLGFTAAILAIFVAYVRAAARVAGAPQDYCGPMAKQHRMFTATAAALLSAVVPIPLEAPEALQDRSWATLALVLISAGCVVTAARRIVRAARKLRSTT